MLRIKEFPADDQLWRVDWIPRINRNEDVESEPKALVLLSALKSNHKKPLNSSSRTGATRKVWIGVGQLLKIKKGSVWQNKQCISIPSSNDDSAKKETFSINTKQLFKTRVNQPINFRNKRIFCISKEHFDVGDNFEHLKSAILFAAPVKNSNTLLILPSFVLLRCYYLCSSKVTRAIFHNNREELISAEESFLLENGSCQLVHYKNYDRTDSWLLARWSSSIIMQEQISNMHRMMITESINHTNTSASIEQGVSIDIGFPFEGESRLTVMGKFMLLNEDDQEKIWGFLVTSIEECTHPMPYRGIIEIQNHDARPKENSGNPDSESSWRAPAEPFVISEDEDILLSADEEPSTTTPLAIIEDFANRFPDLNTIEIIKRPGTTQNSTPVVSRGSESDLVLTQYGSGEGIGGETNTAPINIRENHFPIKESLDADLETFFSVIAQLRQLNKMKGWQIQSLRINGRGWALKNGDPLTSFPTAIRGCYSWHLMQKADPTTEPPLPNIPRALAVVKIESPSSKVVYLLEMERKKDKYCLIILRKKDYSPISDRTFHYFLCETARNNDWKTVDDLNLIKIRHHKKRSLLEFTQEIANKIFFLK